MTQRILDDANEQLAAVEGGIATLQAKYQACLAKKNELDNKYQLCEARLVRADKVRRRDEIRQHFIDPQGGYLALQQHKKQTREVVRNRIQICSKKKNKIQITNKPKLEGCM